MKEQSFLKVDMLIIDRSVKDKVGLTPSSFMRKDEGNPAIAIINHKLEDICHIGSNISPVASIVIKTIGQ